MLECFVMKKIRHSPDFWAVLTLIILWILFFWRLWTPIEADQLSFAEGDFSGQFVAWTDYAVERLENGDVPLWNPYQYGGAPFQADPQTALTYPPRMVTLATLLLQSEVEPHEVYSALQREVMVHVLLASLFVYVFVRRLISTSSPLTSLPLREKGSMTVWGGLAAGITYAYGGYVTGYPILQAPLLEAGIWLPLVLLGILEATTPANKFTDYELESRLKPTNAETESTSVDFLTHSGGINSPAFKWRWLLFSAVFLGISLLAGHPQTSFFTICAAVMWLAYRLYPRWRLWLRSVIFLGGVSGALAAIQLIPTAEFSLYTSRVDMTFESKGGGYSFAELSNMLFPIRGDIWNANYLGLVALVLMGIAIWRRVPRWGFFTALFGVAFFLSFGQKTALYGILYPILPGLSLFRGQERVMFLMAHSAAILVGLGVAQLMQGQTQEKSLRQTILILFSICGVVALVFFMFSLTEAGNRAIEDRLGSAAFSALIFAVMLLGLGWFLQNPSEKMRLGALIGLLVFDLFSANAMLKLNYEPIPIRERMLFPAVVQHLDLANGERIDSRGLYLEGYSTLYRMADISGSDPLQLAPSRVYLEEIPSERAWEILAVAYAGLSPLPTPRPFAHPVYGYYQVATDEEAYGFLREPAFDVRNLAILETEVGGLPDAASEENADVTITHFAPEKIALEVELPENAILTLALMDYPGWEAQIDGEDAEILRNYGGLSAVYVPAGTHEISLTFRSRWLPVAAVISLMAWVSVVVIAVWGVIRRKPATMEENQGASSHG